MHDSVCLRLDALTHAHPGAGMGPLLPEPIQISRAWSSVPPAAVVLRLCSCPPSLLRESYYTSRTTSLTAPATLSCPLPREPTRHPFAVVP